ncbi:beta-lactamase superfamily domain-containing protein [Cercophora newfieldiana]|uniref:Beta-lactamase superfamily domain-containing protein n=1 Tax=Cercophora newfieldiana TaxID=92897 RepID=A0AA40CK50_9PEZI|nr:beta-lactamase superfamily domain-containing protein [Cercophora newfieldiana]
MSQLILNPSNRIPLLKTPPPPGPEPRLPISKSHTHPTSSAPPPNTPKTNASIYFIGNATTLLTYHSARILTDPNFLHAGDHVHLGPGVSATRLHDSIVDLDVLPPVDCILLSHYHEDHFDRLVEDRLNRDFPIVTSKHAEGCLSAEDKGFRKVKGLDFWEGVVLPIVGGEVEGGRKAAVKVTGMPGKHVPPGPLAVANEILGAVPPTNGWMVELGHLRDGEGKEEMETGYRIYISGDTLFVDELEGIPEWLNGEKIDLMLVHLGGTTIPGPKMPLLMVTMDGKQGVKLMQLVDPEVTVPIHFDDYDVMLSGLDDFKKEVEDAGLGDRVVYLDRGGEYRFDVN